MATSFLTDAIGSYILKDPTATLDYQIDWSAWLGTDTISNSTWTCDAGITKSAPSATSTTATIWLSGGTLGAEYLVTNTIITVGGRTEDRQFRVRLINR